MSGIIKSKDNSDMKKLAISELSELHEYSRKLFDFDAKWNGALWAANAVAVGWLMTGSSNRAQLTLSVVFIFVNLISVYGLGKAVPRFSKFAKRLIKLEKIIIGNESSQNTSFPVDELRDVLLVMRRVSVVLVVAWTLSSIHNLLIETFSPNLNFLIIFPQL